MAVIEGGTSASLQEVGVAAAIPAHVVAKPDSYATLGHYVISITASLVATQAANGTLFSWRWGDATRLAVLKSLRLSCQQTAAATATIAPRYNVIMARAFTVSDSGGGGPVVTSGNNMKRRTSMGTSLLTDARASNAAAGLTVGTRTLDGLPFAMLLTQQTITTMNQVNYAASFDFVVASGGHGPVFAQNEGFIVQGPTTVFGAAGTADLVVEVGWAEVTAY